MKLKSTLFITFIAFSILASADTFKKVAYIPSYRMTHLEDINYDLITHVMAAFANPDEEGNLSYDGYDMHTFVSLVHSNNAEAIISLNDSFMIDLNSENLDNLRSIFGDEKIKLS